MPWRSESAEHEAIMDKQLGQIQAVHTGLNQAMEAYKFSESSKYTFTAQALQAGPSTNVHPQRQRHFGSGATSLGDSECDITWLENIRAGARSNGEADEAAGGAAGGAACGAAGGAAGRAGDPPSRGSNAHSNNGNTHDNLWHSRRQQHI